MFAFGNQLSLYKKEIEIEMIRWFSQILCHFRFHLNKMKINIQSKLKHNRMKPGISWKFYIWNQIQSNPMFCSNENNPRINENLIVFRSCWLHSKLKFFLFFITTCTRVRHSRKRHSYIDNAIQIVQIGSRIGMYLYSEKSMSIYSFGTLLFLMKFFVCVITTLLSKKWNK